MRRWIGLAIAGGILCLAPLMLKPGEGARAAGSSEELAKVKTGGFAKKVDPPPLTGVNLAALRVAEDGTSTAPAHGGRVAHLTLDANLQRYAEKALKAGQIPEASVILTDVRTGRILVYANHIENGPRRDVSVEAKAPAASVFKIITGTALVDHARLTPETKQCYWGGEHKVDAANLVENPERDKWCATISEAMGRSLNTVFARLALKHLDREKLSLTARAYGFNQAPVFDVPVAAHTLELPEDNLGFARTSAGFWNSTLSPLAASQIALTVANRGLVVRPYVVDRITDPKDGLLYKAPARTVLGRAIRPETADAVTVMMEATVSDGTGFKAFHDRAARAYLPNIPVAGKTGTLIKQSSDQFYTWFVGFAPSRAPEVAIAVLAVNKTTWRVKANTVARQVLQAYFASRNTPGVAPPRLPSALAQARQPARRIARGPVLFCGYHPGWAPRPLPGGCMSDEMSDWPEDDDDLPEDDEPEDDEGDEPEDDEESDEESDEEPDEDEEEPGEESDEDEEEPGEDEESDEESDEDGGEDEEDDESDEDDTGEEGGEEDGELEEALDEDDDAFEKLDAPEDNFEDDDGDWTEEDYEESAHELFSDNPYLDEAPEQRFLDEGFEIPDEEDVEEFVEEVEQAAPEAKETLRLFERDGTMFAEGFVRADHFKQLRSRLPGVDFSYVHLTTPEAKMPAVEMDAAPPPELSDVDPKDAVDLRKYCSPIGDQGQTNRCSAFAWTHGHELVQALLEERVTRLSCSYSMLLFQRAQGDEDGFGWAYEGGEGTEPGTRPGKQLVKLGSCRQELWPDNRPEPSSSERELASDASKYKLKARLFPIRVDDLKKTLSAGYPVHVGMDTGRAFMNVGRDGIVKANEAPSGRHGRHAMLIVGFQGNYFIVKNSWGTKWGDKGYCYIPKAVLAKAHPEFVAMAPQKTGGKDEPSTPGKKRTRPGKTSSRWLASKRS